MKDDPQFVTALARGVEVLRCFTAKRPELGTTDIAQLTGLREDDLRARQNGQYALPRHLAVDVGDGVNALPLQFGEKMVRQRVARCKLLAAVSPAVGVEVEDDRVKALVTARVGALQALAGEGAG